MTYIDSFEVVGFLITIVAGLLFHFLWTENDHNKQTFIVVILGILLTVSIAIKYQTLPQIGSQLSNAKILSKNVYAASIFDKTVEAKQVVETSGSKIFSDIYWSNYKAQQNFLDKVISGEFVLNKEEVGAISNKIIKYATKIVMATSYIDKSEWWDKTFGKRYEELNYEAIGRNVKIVRFFILPKGRDASTITPLIQRQHSKGVEVYVIDQNLASYEHDKDYIYVDDILAGVLDLTTDKKIIKASMYTNNYQVGRIREKLERLKVKALEAERYLQSVKK